MSHEYMEVRRTTYDFGPDEGKAVFVAVCTKCARFVKADAMLSMAQIMDGDPTATCSKCGRTQMLFEGWF